ncbi:hypothetical protein SUDANB6_00751 [Streptomyces sp. enrichment culture]
MIDLAMDRFDEGRCTGTWDPCLALPTHRFSVR